MYMLKMYICEKEQRRDGERKEGDLKGVKEEGERLEGTETNKVKIHTIFQKSL